MLLILTCLWPKSLLLYLYYFILCVPVLNRLRASIEEINRLIKPKVDTFLPSCWAACTFALSASQEMTDFNSKMMDILLVLIEF